MLRILRNQNEGIRTQIILISFMIVYELCTEICELAVCNTRQPVTRHRTMRCGDSASHSTRRANGNSVSCLRLIHVQSLIITIAITVRTQPCECPHIYRKKKKTFPNGWNAKSQSKSKLCEEKTKSCVWNGSTAKRQDKSTAHYLVMTKQNNLRFGFSSSFCFCACFCRDFCLLPHIFSPFVHLVLSAHLFYWKMCVWSVIVSVCNSQSSRTTNRNYARRDASSILCIQHIFRI